MAKPINSLFITSQGRPQLQMLILIPYNKFWSFFFVLYKDYTIIVIYEHKAKKILKI